LGRRRGIPSVTGCVRKQVDTKRKTPIQGLTIYLIKEGYDTAETVIRNERTLEKHEPGSGPQQIGALYVQPSRPKPPRWARFFQEYIDPSQLGRVASAAAVLLVEARQRLFAITFGQGRHLLYPECWEERFGLRVALNSIGESNVRSIDKRTFDAISRHSREQASREVAARDFGLDIEQDLLRAVTGTPREPTLGRRMYGMDALHASVQAHINSLRDLLSLYYDKYQDQSYRKSFPWIDQIAEITDRSLVEELDEILIRRIVEGDLDRIWMAVPDVVPWERIDGFRYGFGRRSARYHDIHLPDFLDSLRDSKSLSKKLLTQRQVYCMDNDGVTFESWQVYRCLYAELDREGDSYLLSGGKWYRLTRDFVKEVNEAYRLLPRYQNNFPEYDDPSETAYNERVATSDPSRYALMDRKNISYGGGYTQIEFCDLFADGRDIVHVKRYGGSSVLSHLFAQGLVSGELFHTEPAFRRKVNARLPRRHRLADDDRRPRPDEFQVVFAVISDPPGDLVIPFFSRLNLKHAARRLAGYGYRVSIAKIDVSSVYSKLKRYD